MSAIWARVVASLDRAGVQRINDAALEYVTVLLRGVAVLMGGVALVSIFAWIWAGGWKWGATLGASVVIGVISMLLGFWVFGNKEWFDEH